MTGNLGPLSYGQRALWFLQQIAPENVAYNVMLAARITSAVDIPILRSAFQSLVDRHASLRTIFPVIKGKPVQQVLESHAVSFHVSDVSTTSGDDLKARLVEQSHVCFNLETGPILRVNLFTRQAGESVLLLTMHHIAVDMWSFAIMLEELRALYASRRAGVEACLPALDLQYLDFARWQVEMLAGPEGERLWAYWQKQLAGHLPDLNLPTDKPRLRLQTFQGATHTFKIDSDLTRRLKSLAEVERCNLYTILLAAFNALLHHYTGQEEILVGSPLSGRNKKELERLVGYFHNPVVLRAKPCGAHTFKAFLATMRRIVQEAVEHQNYPFPLLVERLLPTRDPSRSPLFQAMFVFYQIDEPALWPFLLGETGTRVDLGGLELESIGLDKRVSMLDLTLTLVESNGAMRAGLEYNTDLFEAATITRMAENLEGLLRAVAEDPERRICDLALSTGASTQVGASQAMSLAEVSPVKGPVEAEANAIDFSLFYFASDDSESSEDRYRLLIEGAKYADQHGFTAVWTPERHFHAFGAIYPNPSVTSAAIATITEKIKIRAGSVVLPLHNPIRVAEEWSVVDNLSKGRVGVSFASGWNADDFVFAPQNYAARKEIMVRDIELVRKLWRGEAVYLQGVANKEVEIKILPRPIQRELPIWVTAFGAPETFRIAGKLGANILTHLLGQSVELLTEKIAIYRESWREHGQGPGQGHVTLMLHTFVGEDIDAVREKVRIPFSNYLKSSLDLLTGMAKSAGLDIDPKHFTEANLEAIVAHAYNRYYETSGLFGTPESCLQMIGRLKTAGVDEVACLIDFGVDAESVLDGLVSLNRLREMSQQKTGMAAQKYSSHSQASTSLLEAELEENISLAKQLSQEREEAQAAGRIEGRAETRRKLMTRNRQARDNRQAVVNASAKVKMDDNV